MEEVGRHGYDEAQYLGQDKISNGIRGSIGSSCNNTSTSSSSSDRCSGSGTNHGPQTHHHIDLINPTRKSNLKKTSTTTTTVDDQDKVNQFKTERKVSWPDAHGKDIAHVQEFEPSVSDDGELEGVRNSCVCAIQ